VRLCLQQAGEGSKLSGRHVARRAELANGRACPRFALLGGNAQAEPQLIAPVESPNRLRSPATFMSPPWPPCHQLPESSVLPGPLGVTVGALTGAACPATMSFSCH
jgi:hypothetical protein